MVREQEDEISKRIEDCSDPVVKIAEGVINARRDCYRVHAEAEVRGLRGA